MPAVTDLGAIRDAWSKETGGGRDEAKTRQLADAYVDENPGDFLELAGLDIEQLVKAVEVFRAAGMVDSQWKVEVWLLHRYEPQNIGGPVDAKVRVVAN